ncbi:MAG: uroporphyrinogen decarboxylase family protein [Clostridium sp.]
MFLCGGKSCLEGSSEIFKTISFDSFVECRSILYNLGIKDYEVGKYYFSSVKELLEIMEKNTLTPLCGVAGDLSYSQGVIEYIKESNEVLCLNIEGAFTILSSLINPIVVFKECKRNREGVILAIKYIEKFQFDYINQVSGIKMISLAEPSGDINIIGPKTFKEFIAPSNIKLIKHIQKSNVDVIHLCGRLSTSLEKVDELFVKKVTLELDTYENHILSLSNGEIVCHSCTKMLPLKRRIVHIGKLKSHISK